MTTILTNSAIIIAYSGNPWNHALCWETNLLPSADDNKDTMEGKTRQQGIVPLLCNCFAMDIVIIKAKALWKPMTPMFLCCSVLWW